MERIAVIGIGPGSEDYLVPAARKAAIHAEVLVGSRRALDLFKDLGKEELLLKPPLEKIINYLKEERRKRKIAVLVSGDAGLYSLLDLLRIHFKPEELEVIPGISSVQMAFARISSSWHDAVIISLHGRSKKETMKKKVLPAVREKCKVAVLTDAELPPPALAQWLLDRGEGEVKERKMVVAENLSYPEERLIEGSLKEIAELKEEFGQSVVLILNE